MKTQRRNTCAVTLLAKAGALAGSGPEPPPGEEPMERGSMDPSSQEVERDAPPGAVVRALGGGPSGEAGDQVACGVIEEKR